MGNVNNRMFNNNVINAQQVRNAAITPNTYNNNLGNYRQQVVNNNGSANINPVNNVNRNLNNNVVNYNQMMYNNLNNDSVG